MKSSYGKKLIKSIIYLGSQSASHIEVDSDLSGMRTLFGHPLSGMVKPNSDGIVSGEVTDESNSDWIIPFLRGNR